MKPTLLPESSILSNKEDCALSCSFNTNCMYWSYSKDLTNCRLIPSGALMNTGPNEYNGAQKTTKSDRYCYPQGKQK